MGKNQSKEHRKSKENTPEPEKRKTNIESAAPTSEVKRQSTLQALKDFATPPGLRKSDSTRSRIQWPSSTKRAPPARTLPSGALINASIEAAKDRTEELKRAQESNLGARKSSFNNRTVGSPERHINDRDTISQLKNISITSPNKPAGSEAQHDSAFRRVTAEAVNQNFTGSLPHTQTTMSMPLKENMRLSPTTTIRSETMANSGIYTKPTKGIFDAANKHRKVSKEIKEESHVSMSTSPPSQYNAKPTKRRTDTIFNYPPRSREVVNPHSEVFGYQSSDGSVITPPRGTTSIPDSASRKRKSDVHGVDAAEEAGVKPKKRLGPEDFAKLAEYGMFEPGALCSLREGVPIPYQILEHIKIYYEEGLCESLHYFLHHRGPGACPFLIPPFVPRQKPTQGTVKHATKLLNCICVSGRGDDTTNAPPSFVPPSSYISLLTTVMIHPSYTTDSENGTQARDNMVNAFNTLMNILDAVGPKQANMKAAFRFSQNATSGGRASRTRRTKRHLDDDSQSKFEEEEVGIRHPLAQAESVWNTATDLWHVVGWALNCSINHKNRWQYYQQWLKIVAYAIDDDMEDCKNDYEDAEFDPISQGILGRTIVPPNIDSLTKMVDTKPALKRAIAACFANGKEQSLKMFPEVWKDELDPAARAEKEDDSLKGRKIFSELPRLPPTLEDMQALRQQPFQEPTDEESKQMREEAAASFGGIQALDMRCSYLARVTIPPLQKVTITNVT